MKRAKIVKMKLAELAGVDLGAQEAQGTVILKRKEDGPAPATATTKRSAITTAVLGHTHLVTGIDDMQSGCTSSERIADPHTHSDGYGTYHSHPWVRTEDGTIVLGEAAGHTHEIGTAAAVLEKTRASNSTTAPAIPTVKAQNANNHAENTMDKDAEIASLKKSLAAALALASLSDAEKIHHATLPEHEREVFVAKSAAERLELVKAANEVVYTCADGTVVLKSQGPAMLAMAKRADDALKLAQAEKAARELTELQKRATETIGRLPGSIEAKVLLLKAAESISDEKVKEEAFKALAGADAVYKQLEKSSGVGGEPPGDATVPADKASAFAALEKGLVAFAKAQNIDRVWTEGLAAYVRTEEGLAMKRAYDAATSGQAG